MAQQMGELKLLKQIKTEGEPMNGAALSQLTERRRSGAGVRASEGSKVQATFNDPVLVVGTEPLFSLLLTHAINALFLSLPLQSTTLASLALVRA